MEIVELLLEHGAKILPSRTIWEETYSRKYFISCVVSQHYSCHVSLLKYSTYLNASLLNFRYCEAFPAIKGAIQRVQREKRVKHKNDDKKSSKSSSKSGLNQK